MSAATSAVVLSGTLTLGASGGSTNVGTVTPIRSSAPFKNLTLIVVPIDSVTAQYDVDVLFDNEVVESHSYPDAADKVLSFMSFGDVIFPPNINGANVPAFYQNGRGILGAISITLALTNRGSSAQAFRIYSTSEDFDSCRMAPLDFS